MSMDIGFVDTETTGLDLLGHEIWEVGLIHRAAGQSRKDDTERLWQVEVDLGKADPNALAINKYFDREDYQLRNTRRQFADDFAEWTRDTVLVVNNAAFDVPRLELLLRANGACPTWHYHPIDVRDYAAGAIQAYDSEAEVLKNLPWSGTAIYEFFHIEKEHGDVHTALGDARAVRDLWDAVTN